MKMIYVSHPYTGNEVENVEDAMKVTNRLAQATGGPKVADAKPKWKRPCRLKRQSGSARNLF